MNSFHISALSDSVLRIENPPGYWTGCFFLVVALVCVLSLVGSMMSRLRPSDREVSFAGERATGRQAGFGWKGHLAIGTIAVVSATMAWFMLQPASLVLDREHGTYTLNTGHLPFVQSAETYPLNQIAYATLETDAAAQRFVIVLQNGQRYGLGAYTDRGNQSEAVAAVNRFLHVTQPGEDVRE
jgi:hypothetical protein